MTETNRFYLPTSELPSVVQRALSAVGYGRKDIECIVSERASLRPVSGKGYRGFIVHCLLGPYARRIVPEPMNPGTFRVLRGSWGGSNAFATTSVDDDAGPDDLDSDECYITGTEGGGRPVYATLYVSPAAARLHGIASKGVSTASERQRLILAVFARYRSSYRKEALARGNVTTTELDQLVDGGFLKRSRNGATRITTLGKNAAARFVPRNWD